MTSTPSRTPAPRSEGGPVFVGAGQSSGQSLADVLERVLDKGIVIVGDIQVRLLDIELLTIKIRLLVASVDKAREMGINWWEGDPFVSSLEEQDEARDRGLDGSRERELEERLRVLEQLLVAQAQQGSAPNVEGGEG